METPLEIDPVPLPQTVHRPAKGEDDRPAPLIFVGGTGRSGTHIVARLLGQNNRYRLMPLEVRFHVDAEGFPGLLTGEVTKEQFLKRMRGFWWKGFQTNRFRGLYKQVPRERFDAALAAFDESFDRDPDEACRTLFLDLLWERRATKDGLMVGLVEQSCDTIAQAPILTRLFPEARFVHVVRDGRDSSASRVSQTRHLIYPRTRKQGLEWWEARIRAIDRGARAIPPDDLLIFDLADLLGPGRRRQMRELAWFAGVRPRVSMREFLGRRMTPKRANEERWRRGLTKRRQVEIDRLYRELLDRLDDDGVLSAPALKRAYRRSLIPREQLEAEAAAEEAAAEAEAAGDPQGAAGEDEHGEPSSR